MAASLIRTSLLGLPPHPRLMSLAAESGLARTCIDAVLMTTMLTMMLIEPGTVLGKWMLMNLKPMRTEMLIIATALQARPRSGLAALGHAMFLVTAICSAPSTTTDIEVPTNEDPHRLTDASRKESGPCTLLTASPLPARGPGTPSPAASQWPLPFLQRRPQLRWVRLRPHSQLNIMHPDLMSVVARPHVPPTGMPPRRKTLNLGRLRRVDAMLNSPPT